MDRYEQRYPLYIFDLDGTIAFIGHRRHLVEAPWIEVPRNYKLQADQKFKIMDDAMYIRDPKFKPDWDRFYEACDMDLPNPPVIGTLLQLYASGNDIRIWSGRSDNVKQKTLMWLHMFLRIPLIKLELMLKMRPGNDDTPDDQLKLKWLNTMSLQERIRVAAVFDDRDKVVAMWRKAGVACFQVAPGDF
jgi:hypothetical protein